MHNKTKPKEIRLNEEPNCGKHAGIRQALHVTKWATTNNEVPNQFCLNQKGQLLSYDIIAASVIFLLIIAASFSVYNNQKSAITDQFNLQEMHLAATNALNFILNDQNCLNGGIVNETRTLSQEKVNCFNSADYNNLKTSLNLSKFEFHIKIFDTNSTILEKGTTANNQAVALQRVATLNNTAEKIIFVVYEK
ncbi:MAG: hypothetical protein WCI04_02560 [archaeon]